MPIIFLWILVPIILIWVIYKIVKIFFLTGVDVYEAKKEDKEFAQYEAKEDKEEAKS